VHVLSFAQAQEAARLWFGELARKDRGEAPTGPLTVRACLNQYLTWFEAHRKSGVDTRSRIESHIAPALGEIQCAQLTTAEIRKWLRDVAISPARLRSRRDGSKPNVRALDKADPDAVRARRASANRTLTILKAALNRAWREGKIASDAAWRRVEPFEEADAARVRYLTVAEAQRLLNACAPDFRPLAQAALASGARYGELAALRVSDFNPDSGTLHVRTSKGGKGRHIVLNDEGVALFRQLTAGRIGHELMFRNEGRISRAIEQERMRLQKAGLPADAVPVQDKGDWRASEQARPMAEACERARIKPAASFHVLRHTWASLAVMNGMPLMVVGRNLGHADTRMVERHYGHLAPSYIADAVRAAAPRFGFKLERKVVAIEAAR
jgi:integrase